MNNIKLSSPNFWNDVVPLLLYKWVSLWETKAHNKWWRHVPQN